LCGLVAEESRADLVLSTVHKAKGREWPRVAIADDFSPFRRMKHGRETVSREDVRLIYVALTRAREAVEIPPRLRRRFEIPR
jgi:superfamily I DNA/RNA helicase